MVSALRAADVLARLPGDERRWVEEFRERVRASFGRRLRDLRLFGSKARGDDHPESDIDLLVLLDDYTERDGDAVSDIAWEISTWLRPHAFGFDGYHTPRSRATGFYKELRRESVRL